MKKIVLLLLTTCFFESAGFSQGETAYSSNYSPCTRQDYFLYYTGGIPISWWEANFGDGWYELDNASEPFNPNGIFSLPDNDFEVLFRVVSMIDFESDYIYSNTVVINYKYYPSAYIEGPNQVCEPGGSVSLTVKGFENFTDILWNTGATTPSITITPVADTWTSVSLNYNGCPVGTSHFVSLNPYQQPDKIIAAPTGSVCGGGPVTLSVSGITVAPPCTYAPNGQYPAYAVSGGTVDGGVNTQVGLCKTGEYSLINVEKGIVYHFMSRPVGADDNHDGTLTTITSADGSQVYGTGRYGGGYFSELFWGAPFTGQIRMYSHGADCSHHSRTVSRFFSSHSNMAIMGSFLWMPGGETTPSITVSPTTTTNYSLVFTSSISGCPKILTKQVIAGIGAVELSTTNVICNSATLNWNSAFNPTQWELEYKSTANGSKWINIPVANASIRSATITGLKLNQNYQWHIRAKCGKSTTPYSDLVFFKTLASCTTSLTQTRSANNATPENEMKDMAEELKVVAMPNPSNTNFRVAIGGVNNLKDPVKIIVSDMLGRVVETRTVTAGQVILIGDKYRSGSYLLRLTQGNKVNQLKLVKVSD